MTDKLLLIISMLTLLSASIANSTADLQPSLEEKKWCPAELTNKNIQALLKDAAVSWGGNYTKLDPKASFTWRGVKFALLDGEQNLIDTANKWGAALGITAFFVTGLQYPAGRGASIKCTYGLEHGRTKLAISEAWKAVDLPITIVHRPDMGNAVPIIEDEEYGKALSLIGAGALELLAVPPGELKNIKSENADDWVLKIIAKIQDNINKDPTLTTSQERRQKLDERKQNYVNAYETISLYFLYRGNVEAMKQEAQAAATAEEKTQKLEAKVERAEQEVAKAHEKLRALGAEGFLHEAKEKGGQERLKPTPKKSLSPPEKSLRPAPDET